MKDVVERLRASKAQVEQAHLEHGKRAGASWARQSAAYDELLAVYELDPEATDADLVGELGLEAPDWFDFLEKWLGTTAPSPQHIEGFIAGASEVWEQVREEL